MAAKNHRPINFKDVTLDCVSCGADFVFTPSQQIAYADRGWSEPRHCEACRGKKHRQNHRQNHRQKQPYQATELDNVLAKARQLIARYRESN